MKICIDGIAINKMQGTGLYTYTYELVDNLLHIYPQPCYEILWDGSEPVSAWRKYKNLSYLNLHIHRKNNDFTALREHLAGSRRCIYHSPNNGFSVGEGEGPKCIMTVHDLLPAVQSKYVDIKYLNKFSLVFPRALERCEKIIAVSYFIEKGLKEHFNISDEKIAVIYPGCSHRFVPMSQESCKSVLRNEFNINNDFILFAGSIHPRKNLENLLRAFKSIKNRAANMKLVMAGKIDGKREEYYLKLKSLCRQLGIEDSVVFTGTVDYKDMSYFYNSAKCALNLSEYEGFPQSTVEAMACGIPVICSDNSSFREAVGDGGCYVNPHDTFEIGGCILETIENREYRKYIVEKGLRQSRKFSWDHSIKKMVSIYESAAYGS